MSGKKINVIIAALAVLVVGSGAYLVFANMGDGSGTVARKSLELSEPTQVAPADATLPKTIHNPASGTTYVSYAMPSEEGESNVFVKRSTDGGENWSEPVQVSTQGKMAARESTPQQMAIGPDGEVYLLWYNRFSENVPYEYGKGVVMFSRSLDNGKSFEQPASVGGDIDETKASQSFQNLTVADDGTIYVAVLHSPTAESEERTIRVSSSKDGGRSWSSGTDVDTGACPCCRPSLETDGEGNLYVGWRKVYENGNDTTIRDNVVARSENGGKTWDKPVKFADHDWKIDGCPHAGPSLGMNSSGELHAAWFTGSEGDLGIYHATSSDNGQSWSEAQPIFTPDYAPVAQPSMLIDSGDNVWITYDDLRNPNGEKSEESGHAGILSPFVATAYSSDGGGHGSHSGSSSSKVKIVQITADGEKITYPEFAIKGKNGDFAELNEQIGLVWKDEDGKIYFSTF